MQLFIVLYSYRNSSHFNRYYSEVRIDLRRAQKARSFLAKFTRGCHALPRHPHKRHVFFCSSHVLNYFQVVGEVVQLAIRLQVQRILSGNVCSIPAIYFSFDSDMVYPLFQSTGKKLFVLSLQALHAVNYLIYSNALDVTNCGNRTAETIIPIASGVSILACVSCLRTLIHWQS